MASEAEVVCAQLVAAVKAMMDPMTPSQLRYEAFSNCERFKETASPELGIQCAIILSANGEPIVHHFGLKLLEDVIKLKWNVMSPQQKLYVKEATMSAMENGVKDILKDPIHIKDAIARNIVEIAKREWPQQWPSFLSELESLSSKSDTATELVMFVILRLVEDVAVLQTLEQHQRRKEIYQALTADMEVIFKFLLTLLERHYQAYLANPMNEVKAKHSKICQAVLATFTAFVEWAPMQHIMANDCYLVKCLCHLLRDDQLQLYAAECLLGIVSWKVGKLSDRAQLMVLFKPEMISPLFEAVEAANVRTLQDQDEDAQYLLLKRLVQILVELGGQVCAIWSAKEVPKNEGKPQNFNVYLNALLALTNHNSLTVNAWANELWAKFCRHPEIVKDDIFKTFLPKWIECALKKSIKCGFPSRDDHASCTYSRMDFETDEEFSSFFGRYRIIMGEVIRMISSIDPTYAYQYCDRWLRSVLATPLTPQMLPVSKQSQIYIELDAIQWSLDAVLSKLTKEELNPILAPGLDLLKLCLDYNANNQPMLASVILSCVSSLFLVVTVTPAALNPTLRCIFECITFETPSSSTTAVISDQEQQDKMPDEVRALRRHGCALMVKIATRYPQTLVPVFEFLRQTIVEELYSKLSKMEFVTLVEGMVLISNELQNFEAQARFIESLAKPVCSQLKNLEVHFASPETFTRFIGFNGAKDCSEERGQVAFCLNFFVALFRRVTVPTDLLKCRSAGFVTVGVNGASDEAVRSPAGDVGCHILSPILKLTKTFIEMFRYGRQVPSLAKVFDMLDIEKSNVHGQSIAGYVVGNDADTGDDQQPNPNPIDDNIITDNEAKLLKKLQMFVYEQFENLFHILAQFCTSLGHQFYKQPGLSSALVTSVVQCIDAIPDYRMRPIVRIFLKSLINKCPKSCFGSVLAPVLSQFCPYMLNRLTEKWKQLVAARELPTFDENNTDSQEVIDDVLGRQITREYLDVIKAILTSGGGSDLSFNKTTENLSASSESINKSHNLSLSELGTSVMRDDALGQCITLTLLRALNWPDSISKYPTNEKNPDHLFDNLALFQAPPEHLHSLN